MTRLSWLCHNAHLLLEVWPLLTSVTYYLVLSLNTSSSFTYMSTVKVWIWVLEGHHRFLCTAKHTNNLFEIVKWNLVRSFVDMVYVQTDNQTQCRHKLMNMIVVIVLSWCCSSASMLGLGNVERAPLKPCVWCFGVLVHQIDSPRWPHFPPNLLFHLHLTLLLFLENSPEQNVHKPHSFAVRSVEIFQMLHVCWKGPFLPVSI